MPQNQRPFTTFFFPNLYFLPTPREKCRLKRNLPREALAVELFECLVREEHEVLQKAGLSGEADPENYLGGSSRRYVLHRT